MLGLNRPLFQGRREGTGGYPSHSLFRRKETEEVVGLARYARFGIMVSTTRGRGWWMNVPVVGCAKRKGRETPGLPGYQRDGVDYGFWDSTVFGRRNSSRCVGLISEPCRGTKCLDGMNTGLAVALFRKERSLCLLKKTKIK